MIGVLAREGEARAVEEFFELFKTPWEFWQPGRSYALVLATREEIPEDLRAEALLLCHGRPISYDRQLGISAAAPQTGGWLQWQSVEFPVYGDVVSLECAGSALLCSRDTAKPVGVTTAGDRPTVRIGFDWFAEVAWLLTQGQPAKNARIPTLEIHIALLRAILESLQIPYVEILPAPHGYDFAACLTHDVDFIGIRDHKFDRTMAGFLYRATAGSLVHALRGRLSWRKCLRNWRAALSLPLVHLGLMRDFWLEFDRYQAIERGLGSTFFFLPFRGTPGKLGSGSAPSIRAAQYELARVQKDVSGLVQNGCEVGLHGIDAWHEPEKARIERNRIGAITGQPVTGTRMHWLYWDETSPKTLEDAGFAYDSTFGYNDAIGFRAGTAQPYCPLSATSLLELPLIIQDSAMFYADRMMLSEDEAMRGCQEVMDCLAASGGALTINWHTRSLSPERLWGEFYTQLLERAGKRRVWFGRAQDVVGWFGSRRALRFEAVQFDEHGVRVELSSSSAPPTPSLGLRICDTRTGIVPPAPRKIDLEWKGETVLETSYTAANRAPHLASV